jgi:multidrug resistance efflux pump
VKAPMTGTVLRVLLRPGESFSTISPKPLFTMADLSGRRIRAEVDERDVTKVRLGQKVLITSDALGKQSFDGVVARLATSMGRKKTLTGDPAEKADRDVLEVMVDLDTDGNELPVGLRVTVQFVENTKTSS